MALTDFFEPFSNMHPAIALILLLIISGYLIFLGINGIRKLNIIVNTDKITTTPMSAEYTGISAIAPSVVFIFVGCIFPTVILSGILSSWIGVNWLMPVFLFIEAIAAVGAIFMIRNRLYKKIKAKKSKSSNI